MYRYRRRYGTVIITMWLSSSLYGKIRLKFWKSDGRKGRHGCRMIVRRRGRAGRVGRCKADANVEAAAEARGRSE